MVRGDRARTRLRRSEREALLEASLEIMADVILIFDEAGVIQKANRAAERLFGWLADELQGENLRMLILASSGSGEDDILAQYLAAGDHGGLNSYRQVTGLTRTGTQFPMELRIGQVGAGARRFFTAVVRDLTTIQEAERRSEELRAQLTQVWSLNSMGEMASVLSHELNQPLSAVANYMRAARNIITCMELQDDDLLDAVSRAGDQAVRAGEIIRTMRDLATRGGMQQRPESLSAIISEVDSIVGLLARDTSVRVSYDLYKGDDTVLADRIQVQQMLVNLARNAIEALLKYPSRQLNISTRPDSDDGFVITIADSGPGVDASVAARLFQPLSSTKPEGMGLGLSICAAIVENHKGRIWVEPSSLGGAAFCFTLARAGTDGDAGGR